MAEDDNGRKIYFEGNVPLGIATVLLILILWYLASAGYLF